jgi:hypothetical protein
MAVSDDVAQGYAERWDELVAGTRPLYEVLRKRCSDEDSAVQSRNVGHRLAARDFAALADSKASNDEPEPTPISP